MFVSVRHPRLPPACDFLCYFLHLGVVNNVDSVNMSPKPLLQILKRSSSPTSHTHLRTSPKHKLISPWPMIRIFRFTLSLKMYPMNRGPAFIWDSHFQHPVLWSRKALALISIKTKYIRLLRLTTSLQFPSKPPRWGCGSITSHIVPGLWFSLQVWTLGNSPYFHESSAILAEGCLFYLALLGVLL